MPLVNESIKYMEGLSAFAVYKKNQSDHKKKINPKGCNNDRPQLKSIKKKKEILKQNGSILKKTNNKKRLVKTKKATVPDSDFEEDSDQEIPLLIEPNVKEHEAETSAVASETENYETPLSRLDTNEEEKEDESEDAHDDPQTESLKLFKWLIAPISPSEFLHKYWEKTPLHIQRQKPNYYKHVLNSKNLNSIIREYPLQWTKNINCVMYKDGCREDFDEKEEGRAAAIAVWDYYSQGCSIRILNPQTYSPKVHLLLATLQEYFGTMVGANVYLTPPNSQGFAPHYDDIEAFVIQLEGKKYWKLYQPTGSDVLARYSSPNYKPEQLGKPFMEVILEAGDLLYFPRGVIHEGRTDEDTHSLHITISVYQNTAYVDLLEKLMPEFLKRVAQENVTFRKGLPLNYLKVLGSTSQESERKTKIVDKINKMLKVLPKCLKPSDLDHAADKLGRKFIYDSMPPVPSSSETKRCSKGDGDILDNGRIKNRTVISLDTNVRLIRYYCLQLVHVDGTIKLFYNTENANFYHGEEEQWLEIDENVVSLIKCLQNNYPEYIKIAKIPIQDDIKLNAIFDLWERGLIVTSKPLPLAFDYE